MQLCTHENLACVSNIPIVRGECFEQCSGISVTSFDQHEIVSEIAELVNYLREKFYDLRNLHKDIKGLL